VLEAGDMTADTEATELVAAVRVALHFDEAQARRYEVLALGAGTVGGLPAEVMWQCHVDGRARLQIASALGETSAFDGRHGMHVGPSGILEPFDLADLDELRMASAVFTGAWMDVGGARFERVRVLMGHFAEGALASPATVGSVGWPCFAGRTLILDWPRRRIAILPGR
jgi:hypothetical protein